MGRIYGNPPGMAHSMLGLVIVGRFSLEDQWGRVLYSKLNRNVTMGTVTLSKGRNNEGPLSRGKSQEKGNLFLLIFCPHLLLVECSQKLETRDAVHTGQPSRAYRRVSGGEWIWRGKREIFSRR